MTLQASSIWVSPNPTALGALARRRTWLLDVDDDFSVRIFDPEAGEYRPRDVFSGVLMINSSSL